MTQAALPDPQAIQLAVIGLGYVGLPLAVGFGRQLPTLGFDVKADRIAELEAAGRDASDALAGAIDQLRDLIEVRSDAGPVADEDDGAEDDEAKED